MQSDAITSVQSVPESLAAILSERNDRTKLGLSKYAAEAAERAGESDGDLRLSRNVRDVAAVHAEPRFSSVGVGVLRNGRMSRKPSPLSRPLSRGFGLYDLRVCETRSSRARDFKETMSFSSHHVALAAKRNS
jgi:hypothetical protein